MSESNSTKAGDEFFEQVVERAADAMREFTRNEAREKIAKLDLQLDAIGQTFDICADESDRSVAILVFALAERIMLDAFQRNLNDQVKGGWDAVTGPNGVLGTGAKRIELLELLYWIRPRTAADLRLIKSIRNRFAHHSEVHSFEDRKISGWVTTIHAHEDAVAKFIAEQGWEPKGLRYVFLIRSIATICQLISDLAVAPTAIQMRLHPDEVAKDFDELHQTLGRYSKSKRQKCLKQQDITRSLDPAACLA